HAVARPPADHRAGHQEGIEESPRAAESRPCERYHEARADGRHPRSPEGAEGAQQPDGRRAARLSCGGRPAGRDTDAAEPPAAASGDEGPQEPLANYRTRSRQSCVPPYEGAQTSPKPTVRTNGADPTLNF